MTFQPTDHPTASAPQPSDTATFPPAVSPASAVYESGTLPQSLPGAPTGGAVNVPGYEILGELGRGGMGVVYRARQTKLGRVVALKMILAGGHAGKAELARFKTEAEAVARLQHPNIVQIFDVGEHDGLPYISLEFVVGGSLAQKLDGAPWAPRDAARLVETLARAIHAAHQAGVVHRDLKPANVLLTADGAPKITDFGLAKKLDDSAGPTVSGAVMGTPSYMAPEQAGGKAAEVGPSADVYALGAILYELVTGRPPFKGTTALDTMLQVVNDEPVPPRLVQSKTPRDLETICLKCLQKAPRQRYGLAAALADDLRRFQEGKPIAARPVGAVERGWRWCGRNPALAGALAALMLTMALGTAAATFFALRAGQNAERADKNALEADKQRKKAIAERDQMAPLVYGGQITLAQHEWQNGDPALAWHYLDSCQWNLRGWEHNYLFTQFSENQRPLRESITLDEQKDIVLCAAYSPDGKYVVSGGEVDSGDVPVDLKVWDAATGAEVRSLKGHTRGIYSVAYSPDGKRIVSGGGPGLKPGQLKVWDAETGVEIRSLTGHTNSVWGVAYSPDGRRIASACADGVLKVWDAETGAELRTVKTGATLQCVAYSPDRKHIVSGNVGGWLQVWDADTGVEALPAWRGHINQVNCVAYSPDGKFIVSGTGDRNRSGVRMTGELTIWDAATGAEVHSLKGHQLRVSGAAYSPDGKRIVSASWDQTVKVWDADTGVELFAFKAHPKRVSCVSFSPDSKRILTGSWDKTLKIWAADKTANVFSLAGHRIPVSSVAFSPDGKRIVSAGIGTGAPATGGEVKVWDAERGEEDFTVKAPEGVYGLAYSPDGKQISCAGSAFVPKVLDAETGAKALSLSETESIFYVNNSFPLTCIAYSPDGRRIVCASGSYLRMWDGATGRIVRTISAGGSATSMAFCPDGKRIAVAFAGHDPQGWDGDWLNLRQPGGLMVWDVETGQRILPSLKGSTCVAFSPDGKLLVSASKDNALTIWDADGGAVVHILKGHAAEVSSVAYSPDGKHVVSGDVDGVLKLWDADTGAEIASIKAHMERVTSVAYSPDGKRVVSGSHDGTVKVWLQ